MVSGGLCPDRTVPRSARGGDMAAVLPDPASEFGERVARRLREEVVAWLIVVDGHGRPQPAPVWFLWDGETALIYSDGRARRLRHLREHPEVALHLDSNG